MSLLLSLLLGTAQAAPEMIPITDVDLVGRAAPLFDGEIFGGGAFKLEDQRGKTVVLSFWASWCGPCRHELPALSAYAKEHPELAVFAVNVDRDPAQARRFLAQVPLELPVVWDNTAAALGSYEVVSMPTMFVLDRNLTVKWRKVGFSSERGLSELQQTLAEM
ncbi:MAG: TlpA family protein disulfide reductase [Alphaproteobacteria bacterium]|nr:TlpA family protein disulfide reductase [Alphaproteobacteria bacterium]